MKEDFVAYLWKNKLLTSPALCSVRGEKIEMIDPGQENTNSGPDFFAARIRLDDTLWVGNVEVHTRTSDWQKHGHDHDPAYDNIILHVVFENDCNVTTSSGKMVPVLEVKKYVEQSLLENYQQLIANKQWIPCQNNIGEVHPFFINNWLNRLLIERLERKAREVFHFYNYFSNNWDQTFYFLLARNFGFKVNASAFGLLAQRTPYPLLAKNNHNFTTLEALLFGQAGLLSPQLEDVYPRMLLKEYHYQKKKHNLEPLEGSLWKFARLRPVNFPTLRVAQFAMMIHLHDRLFSKMMQIREPRQIKQLFHIKASPYWEEHYTFDKPSAKKEKKLGAGSIYNLIINTVAPVQFVYASITMNGALKENAVNLFQSCIPEKNAVIARWKTLNIIPQNAADSQALLELKKYYCTPKKCLRCPIGHMILRKK
ncbi:MAG: DUF2851 family protein [Bacteroidales bacterium]